MSAITNDTNSTQIEKTNQLVPSSKGNGRTWTDLSRTILRQNQGLIKLCLIIGTIGLAAANVLEICCQVDKYNWGKPGWTQDKPDCQLFDLNSPAEEAEATLIKHRIHNADDPLALACKYEEYSDLETLNTTLYAGATILMNADVSTLAVISAIFYAVVTNYV